MNSRQTIRTLMIILAAASTALFASCGGGGGKRSITPPLSSNTQLKSLSVSNCGSVFIDFAPETYSYGPYSQGNETASCTVTAEKSEDEQVVTIGGTAALESTGSLQVGLNTISVEVTAADGVTKQAYSIQIIRADAGAIPPTDSSDLSGGSITAPDGSTVPLDKPISPDTYQYSGTVPNSVTTISLADLVTAEGATMTIVANGIAYTGDISSVPLAEGDNVIVLTVHGADGYTQIYTFNIRRRTVCAELAGLVLTWSGVTQNQLTFSASKLVYDLTSYPLVSSISACSVQAAKINKYQAVKINGEALTSKNIQLVSGENTIAVQVTAEDGAPTKTYTIRLFRAAPKSTNAALAGLTVTKCGTVSLPFSANTTSYGPFTQGYNVASYTVTAEKAENAQTVTINGTAGLSATGSLIVGSNTITVAVTAEDGVTKKKYTITIVRDEAAQTPPTDSSDITGGTVTGSDGSTVNLDKPIDPDTHSYTGTVENGTSTISLEGLTTNTGATTTITVNGVEYTGDISSIPLQEGDNVIIVVVHGNDGYDQTYEFIIRRKTSTADLAGLTVIWNGVTENQIDFDAALTAYDLTSTPLDYTISSCTVMTTAANSYQSVLINGEAVSQKSVALAVGAGSVTIDVTAEDGTSTKRYTVALFRNGVNIPENIELTCGDIDMRFDPEIRDYSFSAAGTVDTAAIAVSMKDPAQTIVVTANGTALSGLDGSFALGFGENIITVKVSVPGADDAVYTIRITREDTAESSDSALSALNMAGIVLVPHFDRLTTSYTAAVGNAVSTTSIVPVTSSTLASAAVEVNGSAVSSGETADLAVGRNVVTVNVAAQNPAHTSSYSVTVYRADGVHSNNSALAGISVSPSEAELGTLFNPNIIAYSANVGNAISRVSISPQRAENTQTVTVNGIAVDYDSTACSVPVDLVTGANTVEVVVTAEDGISARTYTLTFNRAQEGVSNNANLSGLSLVNPSTSLVPGFSRNCLYYTAFVDKNTETIGVVPTAADPSSSITVSLTPTASGAAQSISLGAMGSDTVIKVTVTAQDGTTRTYTVTVNRASEAWSNNAKLSSISVSSGTLLPSFSATQLDYVANVGSSVDTVTLAAAQETAGYGANVTFNGSSSGTIHLSYGRNLVEIRSVAQDGSSSLTYTVQIYRREAGLTLYFKMPSDWKGASNRAIIVYSASTSDGTAFSGTATMDQLDSSRDWWSYTIIDASATASVKFQNAMLAPTSSKLTADRTADQYWYDGANWLSAKPSSFPSICVSASPHAENTSYKIPFKDTKVITLSVGGSDVEYAKYTTDGSDPSASASAAYYVNNMQLIIGQNMAIGDSIELRLYAKTSSGTEAAASYQYQKTGAGMTVHFRLPKTWSTTAPTLHQWDGSAGVVNWAITGWKLAPEMHNDGNGWYSYTIDGLSSCGVLFLESNAVDDNSSHITVDQTATATAGWFILDGGTGSGGGHSNRATGKWFATQAEADAAAAGYSALY